MNDELNNAVIGETLFVNAPDELMQFNEAPILELGSDINDPKYSFVDEVRDCIVDDNSPYFVKTSTDAQVNDTTLIQCFYGNDQRRINATKEALNYLILSNPMPKEWVFVEALHSEYDKHFEWLSLHNVKYVFIKLSNDDLNDYIKPELWNIGKTYATLDKLVFLDSDVAFCKDSWIVNVSKSLDDNDVIQAHKYFYLANEKLKSIFDIHSLIPSYALNYVIDKDNDGFRGFSIGMTREFFEHHFKCFDPVSAPGDDMLYWAKITGKKYKRFPYMDICGYDKPIKKDVKISVADEVMFHIWHGSFFERNKYTDIDQLNAFCTLRMHQEFVNDNSQIKKWTNEFKIYKGIAIELKDVKEDIKMSEDTEDIKQECQELTGDIALVQCFWGTDNDKIECTIRSFNKLLKSTRPTEWVFVEALKNKQDAMFAWVKNYGVKYIFKKIEPDSEGLWLKMPLWNIGMTQVKSDRVCFIDSDIYFTNCNWLVDVEKKFNDNYDIIQINGYSRDSDMANDVETIGHMIAGNKFSELSSMNVGFAVAMTTKAYDRYGRFDACSYLDDHWFWFKIVGNQNDIHRHLKLPYTYEKRHNGLPFKIGTTENIAIHINSSRQDIHELALKMTYDNVKMPFAEITYDKKKNALPAWNLTTRLGKTMNKCFEKLFRYEANETTFFDMACDIYGKIDEDHPLVIVSIYNPDYNHLDNRCVLDHYNKLSEYCNCEFTYVCLSNEEIEGIDTIPYELDDDVILDDETIERLIFNKKIVYPKNVIVLYSDIDDKIALKFDVYYNIDRRYLTIADVFMNN